MFHALGTWRIMLALWIVATAFGLGLLAALSLVVVRGGNHRDWAVKLLGRLQRFRCLEEEGVVFQRGWLTCGVACTQMLLNRFGLAGYRDEDWEVTDLGVNMASLQSHLSARGLDARGVHCSSLAILEAWLDANPAAVLLLLRDATGTGWLGPLLAPVLWALKLVTPAALVRHWVILEGFAGNRNVRLADPFYGRIEIGRRRLTRIWTGLTLVVGRDCTFVDVACSRPTASICEE